MGSSTNGSRYNCGMAAYVRRSVHQLVDEDPATIVGLLEQAYAADGFASQYTRQTRVWGSIIPALKEMFVRLLAVRPEACAWFILIEYPLYRLRRRIDMVILADSLVVVVECKVGANAFAEADRRQVEEYALDLRDFHAESYRRRIVPVLWSTDVHQTGGSCDHTARIPAGETVGEVIQVGTEGLEGLLASLPLPYNEPKLIGEKWDRSAYRPIPGVIEAATSIFSGHDVRAIANADADNLQSAAARLLALIAQARKCGERYLLLLTGVPGSGKTLAGLHVVHSAVATGLERQGEIVYLSGNTPLVVVLREALARDENLRRRWTGASSSLGDIRRKVRARIQHINDFLQESLRGSPNDPPHEHVIVFDEAQRAWDEKAGSREIRPYRIRAGAPTRTDVSPPRLVRVRLPNWRWTRDQLGGGGCVRLGRGPTQNEIRGSTTLECFRSA